MASKRVLVAWLNAQSKNRIEQAEARRKDHAPDAHLMARFREEASMFAQAAVICEKSSEYGNGPAVTDYEGQLAERDRFMAQNAAPAEAPPVPPKNKGGRPRKMTMQQIEAASHGPAIATES